MSPGDQAHGDSESSPGMDALTIGYCVLFVTLYLMYFGMVYARWEVS